MSEAKKAEKEKYYVGYFLMDSGLKIPFEISEEGGGDDFSVSLYGNMEFPWGKGDIIYLGESSNLKILAEKIVGWEIDEIEREV